MSNPVIPSNQASGAFQRWQPESFDPPPPPPPPPPAPQTPAEPEDPTLEIAPGVTLPTAEELDRIQQDAFRDGYDAGYEEGSARGRMEAAELHGLLQNLDEALARLDQEIATEVLTLALDVARQVVRDTLTSKPETVLAVVREALALIPQQHAQVRLHPGDAALVRQYLGESLHHAGHRIVEDANIARGGCLIDTAGGQVDAQLGTRWQRVVENLAHDVRSPEEDG